MSAALKGYLGRHTRCLLTARPSKNNVQYRTALKIGYFYTCANTPQ